MGGQMEKKIIIVGTDDSKQGVYGLKWTLEHLVSPLASLLPQQGQLPLKIILLYARPAVSSVLQISGPATSEVVPLVEADLKRVGIKALENAKAMCCSHNVRDVEVEMVEGDARNVLCDAVTKHRADLLVLGSHGYGAIKRVVLGSVSDYCAHHADCTVLIVKKLKGGNPGSSSSS